MFDWRHYENTCTQEKEQKPSKVRNEQKKVFY